MGNFIKGEDVQDGTPCRITAETISILSKFKGKDKEGNEYDKYENHTMVAFGDDEPVAIRINKMSINAFIDAFGEESKDWIGKPLTAYVKEADVAGKVRSVVYLVPEGFKLGVDAEKRRVIVKE